MRRTIHHPTWREIGEGALWVLFGLFFIFACASIQECRAQNVTRKGNVFIQNQSSKMKKDSVTLTGYFYVTSDGTKYPIYMSSSGKCFILRTSAKTGKQYKQYLPEITKQLNGK